MCTPLPSDNRCEHDNAHAAGRGTVAWARRTLRPFGAAGNRSARGTDRPASPSTASSAGQRMRLRYKHRGEVVRPRAQCSSMEIASTRIDAQASPLDIRMITARDERASKPGYAGCRPEPRRAPGFAGIFRRKPTDPQPRGSVGRKGRRGSRPRPHPTRVKCCSLRPTRAIKSVNRRPIGGRSTIR